MLRLTEAHAAALEEHVLSSCGTCYNCMPFEDGEPIWLVPHRTLANALKEALQDTGVGAAIRYDYWDDDPDDVLAQMDLRCPNCGTSWEEAETEVGDAMGPPEFGWQHERIAIPTLGSSQSHFGAMFGLYARVLASEDTAFTLDFSRCGFLEANAVAFLGGLRHVAAARGIGVAFDVTTIQPAVATNLRKNRFLTQFGIPPWPYGPDNAVIYRHDPQIGRGEWSGLTEYLRRQCLRSGWLSLSDLLKDAIISNLLEIYLNAVEHSRSGVGIFTCGQHYPRLRRLQLTIVDCGVGIPGAVRSYFGTPSIPASRALQWAFERSTTTATPGGYARGLGLDILKSFVKLNKGTIVVYSNEGRAAISADGEAFTDHPWNFHGTVVNIEMQCDDVHYVLSSELPAQPTP